MKLAGGNEGAEWVDPSGSIMFLRRPLFVFGSSGPTVGIWELAAGCPLFFVVVLPDQSNSCNDRLVAYIVSNHILQCSHYFFNLYCLDSHPLAIDLK